MYLSSAEINTHLYGELVDSISRSDNTILIQAIDAAVAQATGYLGQYDTTAIFAATGSNRNALLLTFIKDIAVWHFIVLANPNIELALREKRYNEAIDWLRGVQKGSITPTLPIRAISDTTPGRVTFGSNQRRYYGNN